MNQQPKQVRFQERQQPTLNVQPVLIEQGQQPHQHQSNSRLMQGISELRNSFNSQTARLSQSRETIPVQETTSLQRTPQQMSQPCFPMSQSMCQPMCQPMYQQSCQPMYQQSCQPQCQPQPFVVYDGKENKSESKKIEKLKKKNKKLKEELNSSVSTVAYTPSKKQTQVQYHQPQVDTIKNEIQELERIIRMMENQPQKESQKEIEVHVQDNKKCLKKLCKKVKNLEKELYDVSRQRDEALIIRQQLEKENNEMYDRITELETLLKAADKKVFDLSIMNERYNGYIKQLEDEVERLRRKKKKQVLQPQPQEVRTQEKVVEKPVEIIKTVTVEKIVEKPIEIIKEVYSEPRIIEKIVEIPRIEYVDRPYPQYIEKIVEVPVPYDRIVDRPYEVEVPYRVEVPVERIVEVPVERIVRVPEIQEIIKEVPVERIVEVPVEKIVEVPVIKYVDRPYEVIKEVPVERIVEVPVERIVEVPIERNQEYYYRDDRELERLREENRYLVQDIEEVRDRLRNQNRQRQGGDESQQYREYYKQCESQLKQAVQEAQQWEQRCSKLESELNRERQIVSDLQNRLDQMYHQVEVLASENNKKNQDFAIHLEKLQEKHKREVARSRSQNRVEHVLVQQYSPQQQQYSPIQYVSQQYQS